MAIVTDNQLDKIATAVVDRFLTEKIALTDGVVDAAKEANFNPEQIKRLVESVNNMTFLRKFNDVEKSAEDRMVEFETADPNSAIQRILDAAKDLMGSVEGMEGAQGGCPASSPCGDLTDALPESRPDAPPPLNPLQGEDTQELGEPKISGTVMIMKLRKTAEELKTQEYQKRYELTDTLQKAASYFRRVPIEDFVAFEKDALYKWGEHVAPCLQTIRTSLRLVPVEYNCNALTKTARVIDSSTKPMRLLHDMVRCSDTIDQLRQGQEKTAAYLAEL